MMGARMTGAVRIAGVGCTSRASRDALQGVLTAALPLAEVACLAERGSMIAPVAKALGLAVRLVDAADLAGIDTPTRSARITGRFGTGSVAEALALCAAGPGARLILTRQTSRDGMVTLAIAEGATR